MKNMWILENNVYSLLTLIFGHKIASTSSLDTKKTQWLEDSQRSPTTKMAAYTPNANMVDHSVGAQDELHESEASQALMFCFDKTLLHCWSGLFCFPVPTSCCVSEYHEKG